MKKNVFDFKKNLKLLADKKGAKKMIFKMTETDGLNGGFNHGVSLFYDGETKKQDAVILSGVSREVAWKLYQELNGALCNAGLAVQTKNKAANDADLSGVVGVRKSEGLENEALRLEVKKWKKFYYIAVGFLVLSQWLYFFLPSR